MHFHTTVVTVTLSFPIGSRLHALRRFIILILIGSTILGLLYYIIEKPTGEPLLAAFIVLGGIVGAVVERTIRGHLPEWADLFSRDAAYGKVKEDGIQSRTILGEKLIAWSNV